MLGSIEHLSAGSSNEVSARSAASAPGAPAASRAPERIELGERSARAARNRRQRLCVTGDGQARLTADEVGEAGQEGTAADERDTAVLNVRGELGRCLLGLLVAAEPS